jgi:hypothetical protein
MSDPGFSCVYMVHTRAARNSHSGNLWVPSNWRNYAVEEISRQSSLKNFQSTAKPHTVRSHAAFLWSLSVSHTPTGLQLRCAGKDQPWIHACTGKLRVLGKFFTLLQQTIARQVYRLAANLVKLLSGQSDVIISPLCPVRDKNAAS